MKSSQICREAIKQLYHPEFNPNGRSMGICTAISRIINPNILNYISTEEGHKLVDIILKDKVYEYGAFWKCPLDIENYNKNFEQTNQAYLDRVQLLISAADKFEKEGD